MPESCRNERSTCSRTSEARVGGNETRTGVPAVATALRSPPTAVQVSPSVATSTSKSTGKNWG